MRTMSLRDEKKLFDFERDGVYYKKLPDNSLMVVRKIYYRTFWKTEKHVQFEGRYVYQPYNNIKIPMEVDGMEVASIEAPDSAPCEGVISNVSFPGTVSTFGTWLACLTNVTIPNSVTDSHYNSIACCNNLTIPSSVKTIGGLFRCNMVTIPSSVTMIQSISGGNPRCADYKLHDQVLKIDNPKPPTLARNDANEGSVLFVPQGSLDAYKNDPEWGKFKRIIEDPTLSTNEASHSPMLTLDTHDEGKSHSGFSELENLMDAALADGILTDKEKQILSKKAQSMGIDLDELEIMLDARLYKMKKAEEERARKAAAAEEERAKKTEEERIRKAEMERIRKAEMERIRKAEEEQNRKAEEERVRKIEEERVKKEELEKEKKNAKKRKKGCVIKAIIVFVLVIAALALLF